MRNTKKVKVGNMLFGDGNIYIQSMLNTRSDDVEGSVAQALALEKAGCEVVRAAIPDEEALALIPAIKEKKSKNQRMNTVFRRGNGEYGGFNG